ncbi:hybrid sensor histidine kinase/response regulator transcription factor [Pedobacter chitinilyticus]|uniref:histidine kinase n=1 Tax=Pedobacter chitinilyticus TaxID=2233776 RepID=A0A451GDA0_9SPHI|nr:hybrid sensor histidine kinase/response regulator transcription factor [Pedobacter chitinilyticus]RWU10833.1 response regulator [Pedobacter chitinilyticus]
MKNSAGISRLLIFFACLCFGFLQFGEVVAQSRNFRNISVDKGLSQSTGFTIVQDTLGFIWIGTQDGLNRYNGRDFKVYSPVKNEQSSLQSYYIRSLYLDAKGGLWVGGNQGISRYDYKKDNFVNYKLPKSLGEWYISSITEDTQKNIWAVSISGDIFRLANGKDQFVAVDLNTLANGIKKISYVGNWKNNLLFGTDVGLFMLKEKGRALSKLDLGVARPFVSDVYIDRQHLWIATEGYGLIRRHQGTGQISRFTHAQGKNSVSDNNIRTITEDADGNIWLGTFNGLSILNTKTLAFENHYHQISQPYTIGQNSVRYIYRDKQNGMWLGTFYAGISYYHKNDIKFNSLGQNAGRLSLSDEVISAIKEDKSGNFWIGTNDKGLNYWNRSNQSISRYSFKEGNSNTLSSNNIKSIAFDHQDHVLIGTHNGGLNILDPKTGNVKRFLHQPNDPNSISGDLVYSVLKDHKGRIWVGTRSGLDQFLPQTQTFAHIHLDRAGKRLNADEITYLFEDSSHRMWIGTTNGVSQFYADNLLFGNIEDNSLKEDAVNCIVEDQKKRIWVGTRGGLALYDEVKRSFLTFTHRKDFIQGTIYGILPDEEGNLWISTNRGLVRFNPDTKHSQSFYEADGLQNNQFNEYSFCKAKDGMMLFGGIKGISYFYPNAIKQRSLPLKLSFTGLEVFNKKVSPDDGTDILDNHIDQAQALRFSSDYKQFSIFINSFNYIATNRTHYFYKLDGFDATWQRTDDPKISYSNLPSGKYKLLVKAEGPNGEVSAERQLEIVILAPWYNTFWFYLLLAVVLLTAGYFAYKIIKERIRTLHQLKLERVDKERVSYINKVKMDFFTNVSHELRTPLTLILAPLEELTKNTQLDKTIHKKHELMLTNAKRLYNLVDQLFEFRKTEMGTRQLKVGRKDLISFVHEIYESFKPLADKNNIQYTYHANEARLLFNFDSDAVEKILFNLLSNAFKYTQNGQSISIDVFRKGDHVTMKVTDTGIGIHEEDLTKVFDRFYQVSGKEVNLGSGVGLAFTKSLVMLHHGKISVESQPNQGSVFTVELPIADSYYLNDLPVQNKVYELSIVPDGVENQNDKVEDDHFTPTTSDKSIKLLVVDDNLEIVNYLQDYFSETYDVNVAYDGKKALEMLEHQQFDLIISDVMMPEIDGLNFCKRVKQNINTSHIPFILLTAKTETEQQLKGLEMGADDYVTKPFSTDLLAAKVNNLLRSRKRLKEYYQANKEIVPENIAFNTLDEEFLREAISIIELHLSDSEFSVDKFSREIGMSRSNLYLKLKAITGESATDFLKRIRFNKAVELMKSKRYTIAQIAYMCGFNSPSYFSTAFKQYYGCMPTEYLNRLEVTGDNQA